MGVKFNREYNDIIGELASALGNMETCYKVLDMNAEEWSRLEAEDQQECLRTMADDIFYGLGTEPELVLESGSIQYDPGSHIIKVTVGDNLVHLIYLI